MSKLLTFFNETFSSGQEYISDIWEAAIKDESINGFYICHENFLYDGYLGYKNNTVPANTITWYNLLADGNYLYGTGLTRLDSSSQFNNKPCIVFKDDGTSFLRYKRPVTVGTLVMVYLVRVANSYIVYSSRTTMPPDVLYYDVFAPGVGTLWSNELLANSSIYNATSKINGKVVSPEVFIPLNSSRILSVKDISNPAGKELVSGYGGQSGQLGGGTLTTGNSLKGSLAAIITYENNINEEILRDLEVELAKYYIQYTGINLVSTPTFKYLVGQSINEDITSLFVDEWFDIVSYELVSPVGIGLNIIDGIITGTVGLPYKGDIVINVTNSQGTSKSFNFSLLVCRPDPLVNSLPDLFNLKLVLSANKHGDGSDYGLSTDISNKVLQWEDARRVSNTKTIYKFNPVTNKDCYSVPTTSLLNNQSAVRFTNNSAITATSITAKTFVWVYVQESYGTRKLLNTFPDIKGTGVLWTVSTINEIHGQTDVTKLITKVQRASVNTLSYKVPLNTLQIITAKVSTPESILTFSGLENMRGLLGFFACWDTILTDSDLNTVTALLAQRYANSLAPFILNTSTEFRTISDVVINLNTKVSDLQNLPLTFNLTSTYLDDSVDVNGIYTLTATTDTVVPISVTITNSLGLSSTLEFLLDIAIRTNSLYLDLKNILSTDIVNLYIATSDTLTLDGTSVTRWDDYRLNGNYLTCTNTSLTTLNALDGKQCIEYALNGSSHAIFNSPIDGKCFYIVYIRKEESLNKAFLFGQTTNNDFISGDDGRLFDVTNTSDDILNSDTFVNGVVKEANYYIQPRVVNTIGINTLNPLTIDSVAKDRLFTDRSVKGYVAAIFTLDRNLTTEEFINCNKVIRDYYDPARPVLLAHFNTVIQDDSLEANVLNTNSSVDTVTKKFGTSSLVLVANSTTSYIEVDNSNLHFSFLNEDFTITFWVYFSKYLNVDDTFILYRHTDLMMYVKHNKLYIGRNSYSDLALGSYLLSDTLLNTFNHIALVRYSQVLKLYLNGVAVLTITDDMEYIDYLSPILIGQKNSISTPNVFIYLDEFLIYKRNALYISNFTVPSSEYVF